MQETVTTVADTQRTRNGVAYVLEAIIAAFLMLFFVVLMTHSPLVAGEQAPLTGERMHETLNALDTAGELRGLAYDTDDLEQLETVIDQHMPGHQVAVAVRTLNSTSDDVTTDTTYTRSFTVTENTVQQELRVWFRDATDPEIHVNGDQVVSETGTVSEAQDVVDISPYTDTGDNTMTIEVSDTSQIGYSIDIVDTVRSGQPPTGADVFTASYPLSGTNTSFQPMEVTVLSWQ